MATTLTSSPILQDVEAVKRVALLFSDLAGAYNERLKAEAPNLLQSEVYARLQEEQRLRSLSNQLYFEAAKRILADALDDQQKLEQNITKAEHTLKTIQSWQKVLDLVADVIVLAGSLVAGKPGPIIAALTEVREDIKGT